jgi:hypothetical protein
MLDQVDALEMLKWTFIVFAAGFIGFFGKYLGKLVISSFQKNKGMDQMTDNQQKTAQEAEKEQEQKIIKKTMKTQIKALKKKSK